jgi:CrcB protein
VFKEAFLLFLGGGLGTLSRYYIHLLLVVKGSHFPFGTFTANVISSFLIGAFATMFTDKTDSMYRLLFMVGYCGGFSTFSAFSIENLQLLQNGKLGTFLLYFLSSAIVCIVCVWAGMRFIEYCTK